MLCVAELRGEAIGQIAAELAHWEGATVDAENFGAGRSEMAFLDQVLREQRSRLVENSEYLRLATRVSQALGRMNTPIENITFIIRGGGIIRGTVQSVIEGFPPLQTFEFETVAIEDEEPDLEDITLQSNPFRKPTKRFEDLWVARKYRQLSEVIRNGSSCAIVGPSGCGKSMMMKLLAQEHGVSVIFLDMRSMNNEEDFVRRLCAVFKIDSVKSRREVGRKLEKELTKSQDKQVLCLDNLDDVADERVFPQNTRHWLRGMTHFGLQLVVTSRRELSDIFPNSSVSSPWENIFLRLQIEAPTRDEVREVVEFRLEGTGIVFSSEQIEMLWIRSGGNLALLTELAAMLYDEQENRDEQPLIAQIQNSLEATTPIINPYTVGNPVVGDRFIGREDIMRQLEELWFGSTRTQSIVLYGHRRIGKTSILLNIITRIDSATCVAYINLQMCVGCNTLGELLLTITHELSKVTSIEKPSDADLLKLPEITFRRYINTISQTNQKIIIALDEFEILESLISTGKISPTFLSYLHELIQLYPNLAFAFAGLHTLEQMTAYYFAPLFASFIAIRVGGLDPATTRQLLAKPDPDYPINFTEDLLDEAYNLTHGQPYLVNLLGFQLTHHYNTQVFEQNRPHEALFTLEDLTITLNSPGFFYDIGRYYFIGLWLQAAEHPPHQQSILQHLAHHPNQTSPQISQALELPLNLTQISLDALKRNDVAEHSDDDRWKISIELFCRWLIRQDILVS
jgi:Cdc6-like AAA superfamily ATPase